MYLSQPLPLVGIRGDALIPGPHRSRVRVCGFAVVVSVAAVALTWLSTSLTLSATFLLPFAAVAISGWYGGALGGLVTTVTTAAIIQFWLLMPAGRSLMTG